ncbi:MAG TPA: hypothetical protein VLD16_01175 [Gaiellaceae bacterium]|nr:hypothetical protein [Gaiellaceae bacterium]
MDERFGSVRLVDSHAAGDGTFVATIERDEVEKALQSDEPVDLLLDVERVAADGSGPETERIALGWEPEDLERLLAQAGGGEITLTFDEAELRQLLDADVDAHGMRERLVVLSVVAGLAAAGAGGASAMVGGTAQDGAAGTQAAVTHVTASEVSAGLTAAAGPSQAAQRADTLRGEALNQAYGLGTGPSQAEQQADTLRGEALNQEYGLGTGPSQAEQQADTLRGEALNQAYGLGTGPSQAEQRADTLRGEALNQAYGLGGADVAAPSEISTGLTGTEPAPPSEISTGIVQQPAPSAPEVTTGIVSQPTATPASSSPSWTSPSPQTLAIAAGAILAITALGFAARSQRPGPRPA